MNYFKELILLSFRRFVVPDAGGLNPLSHPICFKDAL